MYAGYLAPDNVMPNAVTFVNVTMIHFIQFSLETNDLENVFAHESSFIMKKSYSTYKVTHYTSLIYLQVFRDALII